MNSVIKKIAWGQLPYYVAFGLLSALTMLAWSMLGDSVLLDRFKFIPITLIIVAAGVAHEPGEVSHFERAIAFTLAGLIWAMIKAADASDSPKLAEFGWASWFVFGS